MRRGVPALTACGSTRSRTVTVFWKKAPYLHVTIREDTTTRCIGKVIVMFIKFSEINNDTECNWLLLLTSQCYFYIGHGVGVASFPPYFGYVEGDGREDGKYHKEQQLPVEGDGAAQEDDKGTGQSLKEASFKWIAVDSTWSIFLKAYAAVVCSSGYRRQM